METKLCTSCLMDLPLTDFLRRPDGRSRGATCRKCESARVAAWRKTEKGAKSSLETSRKYNASEAGQAKREAYRRTEANAISQEKYRLSDKGKACVARTNRTEKARHRKMRYCKTGKFTVSQKRYHSTEKGRASLARGVHKRRALMAIESTLTADEWRAIRAMWEDRCAYCGRRRPLTMDHVIPLSKGGHHVASNVMPACLPCNASKNNKMLREWRPEIADRFGG